MKCAIYKTVVILILFYTVSIFAVKWKVGEYTAVKRSDGSISNGKITSILDNEVYVNWSIGKDSFKKGPLKIDSLKPPILERRFLGSEPGKHGLLRRYLLVSGDRQVQVDRFGRDLDSKMQVVPPSLLPKPPFEIGQIASICRTKEGTLNALVAGFLGENALVEWPKKDHWLTQEVKLEDLQDPISMQEQENNRWTVTLGDRQIALDKYGNGEDASVAEIITRGDSNRQKVCDAKLLKGATDARARLTSEILRLGNNFPTTLKLLKLPPLRPAEKMEKDGFIFYLSKPFEVRNDRLYAIMYSKMKGRFYPRLLYWSYSEGGVRTAPAVSKSLHLWKGNYFDLRNYHYTQETKVIQEIAARLSALQKLGPPQRVSQNFLKYFNPERLLAEGIFTYGSEIKYFDGERVILHFFQKYKPGANTRELTQIEKAMQELDPTFIPPSQLGSAIDLRGYFRTLFALEEFQKILPDFCSTPVLEYQTNHLLLSKKDKDDITERVFEGYLGNRVTEWHMANDQKGRIWIDRFVFRDAKVSSYGNLSEVIDSGALTNKPLEYPGQIPPNNPTAYFNDEYVDITPILDELLPIQQYRKCWKIEKTR